VRERSASSIRVNRNGTADIERAGRSRDLTSPWNGCERDILGNAEIFQLRGDARIEIPGNIDDLRAVGVVCYGHGSCAADLYPA